MKADIKTLSFLRGMSTAIAFVFLMACSGSAGSQVVNVWPGVAPGSEKWTQKERAVENTPLGTVVFNVVTPTLTAAEWGLSPDRVGFLGFSAGAMVTSGALLQQDAAARPSFAAMIYGGPFGVMPAIPPKLPPMFLTWAQDDTQAREPVVKFFEALAAAGHKPEVHIFSGPAGARSSH